MNDLKQEDVMRALECWSKDDMEYKCRISCPYNKIKDDMPCYQAVCADALALLREKNAEIERLKAENAVYANGVEKVAENYHRQGRAEAVDEFEERVKKAPDILDVNGYSVIGVDIVEIIAKELKGEKE